MIVSFNPVLCFIVGSLLLGMICSGRSSAAEEEGERLTALPEEIDGLKPSQILERSLCQMADEAFKRWQIEYEKIKSPEDIQAYQRDRRDRFIAALGGLPERTPLQAQTVGAVACDGFRVEKVIFESQPKFFVTACMFLPDPSRFAPPYPGILAPCGHSDNGKAYTEYQRLAALMALNGMAALVYDPIDQGERGQILDEKGQTRFPGVTGHDMVGVGCVLLGQNVARFRIHDGMRALDYLQSRPEVDPTRIGCTGNSGGGTLTSYLMALDDRIVAAAPSCYLTNLATLITTMGPQDAEQNIFGQLGFGMDHVDYLLMRAPRPTLMCAATQDFFDITGTWQSYRYAKRLYSRMGFAERVDLIENDADHGFFKPLREGAARWMMRWLLQKDQPVLEPDIVPLKDEEIECTPKGQVMSLEGAKSAYDLNEETEAALAEKRKEHWKDPEPGQMAEEVRKVTGIRPLAELPEPSVAKGETLSRSGCRIEKLIFTLDQGVCLPGLLFIPEKEKGGNVTLYVRGQGMEAEAGSDGEIESLCLKQGPVLAVDVRGSGPTALENWRQMNTLYLLGRSFMAARAEDILILARYAASQVSDPSHATVDLVAVGDVGVPGLHAATLEPDLFLSVTLKKTLTSWASIIHARVTQDQWINAVHGALQVYDLPDLARALGKRLHVVDPIDARGEPAL